MPPTTPTLEKVADERQGAFLLAKLDTDANQMTASAFGVQSIPTVIAFKDGAPVTGSSAPTRSRR